MRDWMHISNRPPMRRIAEAIEARLGMAPHDLKLRSRLTIIVHPRQEAMAEMHDHGYSHMQIARFFGLKDHTTCIYACKVVRKRTGPFPPLTTKQLAKLARERRYLGLAARALAEWEAA